MLIACGSCGAAYRAALAEVRDELDGIDRELSRLGGDRGGRVMSWIWPDEPYAEPLPYYAVGVCDECGLPAEELV